METRSAWSIILTVLSLFASTATAPALWLVALVVLLVACSDGSDACVDVPAPGCTPQYAPTFQNIFDNTLLPSCGVAGSTCHAPEGAQGGLVLAEIEASHAALTTTRVDSEAPGCGTLLQRVAADEPGRVMPPGDPLPDGVVCAITQWVAMGAPR